MTKTELEALCNLLMVSDPYPLPEYEENALKTFADTQAQEHGFSDWIDAYHYVSRAIQEEKQANSRSGVGA